MTGGRYPLLKTPQDYTEYFNEALSFGDLFDVSAKKWTMWRCGGNKVDRFLLLLRCGA